MMSNALLDFSGLPRFDAITPADVRPAISRLLADNRALVERLVGDDVPAAALAASGDMRASESRRN